MKVQLSLSKNLNLLKRLEQLPADPQDVSAAIQQGLDCHKRMLELSTADQRGAIAAALMGARLLAAVQGLNASQPDWVVVHEEQCCSCAGRWIHALAQTEAAVPAEWLRDAMELLERLQTINADACDWVPMLRADLNNRLVHDRKPSTAALINYFNDEDMLRWQLDGGFLEHYDRIYIWDGPYDYLEQQPLFSFSEVRLDQTELGDRLLADPRVIYHHARWSNEQDKRISAYQAIQEDVIVLHDTDEFPRINRTKLREFWLAKGAIASLQLENLYTGGVAGMSEHYPGESPDMLPRKWVVFKRGQISAEDHIDYLWLVGVEQKPMDPSLLHEAPLCHAYHLTGCRNLLGQTNKIAFYIALALRGGRADPAMENLKNLVDAGELSLEQAQRIFLAGNVGFAGLPHPDTGIRLKQRLTNADFPDELLQSILAEGAAAARTRYQVIDHHPLFIWLPGPAGAKPLTLTLDGPSQVTLTAWRWISGEPARLIGERQSSGSEFVLDDWLNDEAAADCIGHLLMLKVAGVPPQPGWQWLELR
jgi:hypothetical protein